MYDIYVICNKNIGLFGQVIVSFQVIFQRILFVGSRYTAYM